MTSRREDRAGPQQYFSLGKVTLEEGEERGSIYSLVVNARQHYGALARLAHVCTLNTPPQLLAEQIPLSHLWWGQTCECTSYMSLLRYFSAVSMLVGQKQNLSFLYYGSGGPLAIKSGGK